MNEQNNPITTNDSIPVVNELIEYIKQRKRVGITRYGTPLMTFNGRSALHDALDESLDLSQYLMQEILEREKLNEKIRELENGNRL